MYEIVRNEAKREENKLVDSFVVVMYGTPDDITIERITDSLHCDNAPHLTNKPKLVYVIGKADDFNLSVALWCDVYGVRFGIISAVSLTLHQTKCSGV